MDNGPDTATLKNLLNTRDRFCQGLGIALVEVSKGAAVARVRVEERHLNSVNITQGGLVFTLADFAFAAASNSHGTIAVGMNASISYIAESHLGDELTAVAEEISLGRSTANYTVRVCNQDDRLIALFQGLVFRKPQPLPL